MKINSENVTFYENILENDSSGVVSFKKMMSQFMRKEHLLVEGFLGIATVTQFAF